MTTQKPMSDAKRAALSERMRKRALRIPHAPNVPPLDQWRHACNSPNGAWSLYVNTVHVSEAGWVKLKVVTTAPRRVGKANFWLQALMQQGAFVRFARSKDAALVDTDDAYSGMRAWLLDVLPQCRPL